MQNINKMGRMAVVWPIIVCLLMVAAYVLQTRTAAEEKTQAVIRGIVRSPDGAPLYGILVRAKGVRKNYSTYVFTDQNGGYDFPVLPLGDYQVSVGTARKESVQLTPSGVTQDFTNVQLGRDFMNQTTGPNWLKVIPGSEADKERAARYCASCHTTSRFFSRAPASPALWPVIVKTMILNTSSSAPPPPTTNASASDQEYAVKTSPENIKALGDFLAEHVTPEVISEYAARAMMRPTGEAARAVYTEWDLPTAPIMPANGRGVGDAWPDSKGFIWYTITSTLGMGRLDPRTGQIQEWPYIATKPSLPNRFGGPQPPTKVGCCGGFHDIRPDKSGNLWITAPWNLNQIIKFNVSTHQYTAWDIPVAVGDYPHTGDLDQDGNFWFTLTYGDDSGVAKLDPETGKFTKINLPTKAAFTYGIVVDQQNNVWFAEQDANKIGKVEARTGKFTEYPIPTPKSNPARIRVDSKGRLWFVARGFHPQIDMLDPKTGKFSEYGFDVPNGIPYYINIDKSDNILFSCDEGNMMVKLDPETKKFEFFLLPVPDNYPRNGEIDYSTDPYGLIYASSNFPTIGRMYIRKAR